MAVGARGRAATRWRGPTSTRSSARSPASIPIRTGRCAPRWRRTLGDLGARARAGAADGDAAATPISASFRRCSTALAKVGAANAAAELTARLKADDPVVRARRGARAGHAQGGQRHAGAARGLQDARRATACMWRARPRSTRWPRSIRPRRGRCSTTRARPIATGRCACGPRST